MENLLIVGFMFLCVLFAIVLTLQIAAERELKKKARRLEELESRPADNRVAHLATRRDETQVHGMGQELADLKEKDSQPQVELESGDGQLPTAEEPTAPQMIGEGNPLRKRSYAVLSGATVVLFSAAILTAGLWRDDPDKGPVKVTALPVKKPQAAIPDRKDASTSKSTALTQTTVKPIEESQESSSTEPSKILTAKVAKHASKNQAASATPKRQESPSRKSQDGVKTPQPTWMQYKVLSTTPVFSKPSEKSQTVASVAAGMQVNVVGSQGDWLEIRSRHGRPPGFIKKSSAAPASQH